jgi:hypothetical protein
MPEDPDAICGFLDYAGFELQVEDICAMLPRIPGNGCSEPPAGRLKSLQARRQLR